MTYLEAALEILKTAPRPLTTQEVLDQAVTRGLITPKGRTPVASMSAKLYGHLSTTPDPLVRKVATTGPKRAVKGSVTWALTDVKRRK